MKNFDKVLLVGADSFPRFEHDVIGPVPEELGKKVVVHLAVDKVQKSLSIVVRHAHCRHVAVDFETCFFREIRS